MKPNISPHLRPFSSKNLMTTCFFDFDQKRYGARWYTWFHKTLRICNGIPESPILHHHSYATKSIPKNKVFVFFVKHDRMCGARSHALDLRSTVVCAWFLEHGGMCEISWSTVVCVIFHGASCWPVTNNKKIKPKTGFPIDLQQLYQKENCFGGSEIHELRRRPKQFLCELHSVAIKSQVWIGLVTWAPLSPGWWHGARLLIWHANVPGALATEH